MLIANSGSGNRHANSAQTADYSLVTHDFEVTNSLSNTIRRTLRTLRPSAFAVCLGCVQSSAPLAAIALEDNVVAMLSSQGMPPSEAI